MTTIDNIEKSDIGIILTVGIEIRAKVKTKNKN